MRRLILLVLLCLLPLQVSWAAVADYCGHEQGKTVRHFGHHVDGHEASSVVPDDERTSGQPIQHDHCHLVGFLAVPSASAPISCESAQRSPREDAGSCLSLAASPPERPQWLVPA